MTEMSSNLSFDEEEFLESITINGIKYNLTDEKDTYSATYDYTKHINLGLKKRPESDVEIQKDLVSAEVVVNDTPISYEIDYIQPVLGIENKRAIGIIFKT